MLARLWHHALVRGNHQQCGVDAADAGKHILDEIDMSGNINDADGFRHRCAEAM